MDGIQLRSGEFDYSSLPPTVALALREGVRSLGELVQSTALSLWDMGAILADAQSDLAAYGSGTFQAWVEQEANLSVTQAYRLLNVYRAFSREALEEMPGCALTALYTLAEPKTPPKAREEAMRRAKKGEQITTTVVAGILTRYAPPPPPPPLPPLPPKPSLPPRPPLDDAEIRTFEETTLLPLLHDAGVPDAPQMLSADWDEPEPVTEARKAEARFSVRSAIIEAVRGIDTSDEEALEACADEVLAALGEGANSNAISMRLGAALSASPMTLLDLTELCALVCGQDMHDMDREERLGVRKKVLRIIDGLTLAGCGIYEHKLANGQLLYGLMPCAESD